MTCVRMAHAATRAVFGLNESLMYRTDATLTVEMLGENENDELCVVCG